MALLGLKSARQRLRVRAEPHWMKLGKGAFLGFRRGPDTWIARFRDREGMQHYSSLGQHPEFTTAKGAAEIWFEQMTSGARRSPKRGTVQEAFTAYIDDLRRQGRESTAKEAEARFALIVGKDDLASMRLEEVTRDDFEAWRDRLRRGREARSVNRHVRSLVAALNRAVDRLGHVGNRAAWQFQALVDDVDAGGEAAVFLGPEQRALLIRKADKNLAAFLTGLEHTGARPSELAAATAGDFDGKHGTLQLRHRKGRPAKLRVRSVSLSSNGCEFFKTQARNKLPSAPLLATAAGSHWRRYEWSRGIRKAITAANGKVKPKDRVPEGASAYSFRHARISELLQVHGVDPLTVASQTGTSLAMMEKYYFRFVPSALREKLDRTTEQA